MIHITTAWSEIVLSFVTSQMQTIPINNSNVHCRETHILKYPHVQQFVSRNYCPLNPALLNLLLIAMSSWFKIIVSVHDQKEHCVWTGYGVYFFTVLHEEVIFKQEYHVLRMPNTLRVCVLEKSSTETKKKILHDYFHLCSVPHLLSWMTVALLRNQPWVLSRTS